jgi:hypothetical protein
MQRLVSAMNTKKINYIKNVSNLRFNVVGVFGDPYGQIIEENEGKDPEFRIYGS